MNPYAKTFKRFVGNSIRAVHHRLLALENEIPGEEIQSQALQSLDFALPTAETWAISREVLALLAPKMEQAGLRDGWLPYLQRGIERSRAEGDVGTEGELHYHLGLLHELRVRFDDACSAYEKSAHLFSALDERQREARAISRQAYVARLQQRHEQALALAERALSLAPEGSAEHAGCCFTLGTIAFDRREWETSIRWFRSSLAAWERLGDQRMVAFALRNLGPALHWTRAYDEAIVCYERALAIFDEVPDPVHQALTRMNLGIVYSLTGQSERSLALYAQAEPVFRRTEDDLRLALLYGNMGYANRQLSRWQAAEESYRLSIERWRRIGVKASAVNGLDGLGLVLLGSGRLEEALAVFGEALATLEEIPDDPRYDYLHQMVTGHREEAEKARRGNTNEEGNSPVA